MNTFNIIDYLNKDQQRKSIELIVDSYTYRDNVDKLNQLEKETNDALRMALNDLLIIVNQLNIRIEALEKQLKHKEEIREANYLVIE